ncbi:MAG: ribose-phosphate diphosphokinase [Kofleriaceae bacterium]|nr:ribose-phosphate diphosphokinase [Kofleriaceae bacterium]MCL4224935.1 ribose-phosphate diphosphokinase [Myxococcales bacterium]
MSCVILTVPGSEAAAARLQARLDAEAGAAFVRHFPDGEVYVRIDSPVAGREVVRVCGLERPADKILPLLFLAATARDLGARRVGLVAPYLSFMRQDSRFHPGEGITSTYFAQLVSGAVDWLVTVDPHLHRWASLGEIYRIPARAVAAAPAIAGWVRAHVAQPFLIGPDAESEQWVAAVAALVDAPYVVLEKTRRGDRDVSVSEPDLSRCEGHTPVLLDDIISTGRTMVETLHQLRGKVAREPLCVGVHAVFAGGAHDDLLAAGAARVVTCNTIEHPSNRICVTDVLADAVRAEVAP